MVTDFQVLDPTATGLGRSVVEPSPTWPNPFWPQHHSVSSLRMAHVWSLPAETDFQVLLPTATGLNRLVVVPSPTWPLAL
ncbi:MAG: hypothetical protein R2746_11170 [Acidimicrobiales bacterium]